MPTIRLQQPSHPPDRKQCYSCNTTLPLTDFAKRKDLPGGYGNECKKCSNIRKQREKAARELRDKNIHDGNVKVCTICHMTLPVDDFDNDAVMCRPCAKKHRPLTQKDYLNRYLPKKHRRR